MDRTLLNRVADGDPDAVRACIDRYGGLVWSLARKFLRSHSDAEDAVQEIFVDVWRSAARFDSAVASETTFVAMIARRRLIDRVRARPGDAGRLNAATLGSLAAPGVGTGPNLAREALRDEAAVAAEAMSQFGEDQQRALRLALVQGLSHEQVAKATGLPLGTVKTHIRRGLIRIREMLALRTGAGVSP